MHRLVPLGIDEPVRECVFIGRAELGHHDVCRRPVSGGEGEGRYVAPARTPMTDDVDTGAFAGRMLGEPAHQLARLESRRLEVETTFGHDLVFVGQRLEQPITQHPELQAIEQLVSRFTVPRPTYQIVEADRQVKITYQRIHLAVAQHVADPLLECLGGLALELSRMCRKILQPVVHFQPLGGGFRSDARYAWQVVAGLADQRRQVGVSGRGGEIALLYRLGRHPSQIRNSFAWIQHGHVVTDELEFVTVAGTDQHVKVGCFSTGGHSGDHIVGFKAFLLQVGDIESLEHLLDEIELTPELIGSGGAVGLVFAVDLGAEGMTRDVEGDDKMGWLLVPQHIDQHRRESEHPVGVLAGPSREVLDWKRKERPVGNGVAIDQHQLRPRRAAGRQAR